MAKAISRRIFKAGNVLAADSRWTGEEPVWENWESWTVDKFMSERARMLRFYGYYLNQADLKDAVLEYMKGKFPKADVALFKKAGPNVIPATVGKLIRSINRGMPSLHPQAQEYLDKLPFFEEGDAPRPAAKDDLTVINDDIMTCLHFLRTQAEEKETDVDPNAPKPVVMSPMDRLRLKVDREVITHLDEMLDKWTLDYDKTRVEPLELVSYIRDGGIPAAGCKFIAVWLNKHLDEYRAAYDKTCEQCVQGFSNMTRPAIRNRIKNLEDMLAEIEKTQANAKTQRKPRVKKVKDATKQVQRMKYQAESEEYDLKSISPTRVPSAQTVYLFNTKYRTLSVYVAKSGAGLFVQGTTIKEFSPDESFCITLRKPNEVLPGIMGFAPKKAEKLIGSINSKQRKVNGRTNDNTILLRAI